MSDTVLVGAVTTRDGHKLHSAVDGHADCPAVRGRLILSATGGTPLREEHLPLLCKRCLPAIRQAVADASMAAVAAEGNAYDENTVQELAELARALETSAERRAREARSAQIAAEIRAQWIDSGVLIPATPEPTPAPVALPRSWWTIRDEHAAANRHPIAA